MGVVRGFVPGLQRGMIPNLSPGLAATLTCRRGACPLIRIMPTVSTIYGIVSRNCGIYCSFARAHGDLWTSSEGATCGSRRRAKGAKCGF